MITIIKADGKAERRQLDAMRSRAAETNADIELTEIGRASCRERV